MCGDETDRQLRRKAAESVEGQTGAMTTASAQAAVAKMESDQAFAERVKAAGGPSAALSILRSEGFEVEPSEMRDALLDRYGDQLTTEQLDSIAAGSDPAANTAAWAAGGLAITATVAISAGAAAAV
jgi:predicted ribosomally synthesized peptide with nif11-like leader